MFSGLRKNLTRRNVAISAVLVPVFLLLSGCMEIESRLSTMDPKGPLAQMQLDLFMITVWVTLGIFVAVGGVLLWVVIRFRARNADANKPLSDDAHGNPLIEISLIVASVLLLVIIAVPTLEGIWYMHQLPPELEEGDVLEVTVKGYQWWWEFQYDDYGFSTGNELIIPVGKVVKLNLRGEDVMHSFWLPKIAGKTDLIPGRRNWMWIQADETGHYYGQCAEFCGESHSLMLFRANVVEVEEFEAWARRYQRGAPAPAGDAWNDWLQANADDPATAEAPIEHGASLFFGKGGCVQCHAIDGSPAMGALGPNLTNVGDRYSLGAGILENRDTTVVDEESFGPIDRERQLTNLFEWIKNSHLIKPGNLMYKEGAADGFQPRVEITEAEWEQIEAGETTEEAVRANNLSDEEIMNIARYLQTLRIEI